MHRLRVSGDRETPVVLRTLRKWMALVQDVSFTSEADAALLAELNPVSPRPFTDPPIRSGA